MQKQYRKILDKIYFIYNRREYVKPDPLQFLYEYDNPRDREITALIASSLAYGRVSQILKSIRIILDLMGKSPSEYLANVNQDEIRENLRNFRHRFTGPEEITALLGGIAKIISDYGSLYNCFASFFHEDENIIKPLTGFIHQLRKSCKIIPTSLIPDPKKGSACKRLNLFLRWMIRNDNVDPGGWDDLPSSALIIPLDTHMHRFSLECGFTGRKGNEMKTAQEITECFRKISPEDPVKYDFAITRYGIRDDISWEEIRKVMLKNL